MPGKGEWGEGNLCTPDWMRASGPAGGICWGGIEEVGGIEEDGCEDAPEVDGADAAADGGGTGGTAPV